MTLPELREADAPPTVTAIYAALRATSGITQVNLIWRHAAALPGMLDWLWAQARPVLDSGAAAGVRDRIAAQVPLPPMAMLAAPGDVAPLIETYNRGNLINLAVLTAVRLRLAGVAAGALGPAGAVGAPLPAPPALPRLADLPPDAMAIVRDLSARHGLSDPTVVPSLYLHLTIWPDLLARLPAALAPVFANAALVQARDAAIAAAEAEAPGLIAALGPAPPPPEALTEFSRTLALFTREVIPGMVPIGLALRRALG